MSADGLPAPPYPASIVVTEGGREVTVYITPEDVDVRSLDQMPLDVKLLGSSDLMMSASAEEFRAAVVLWCRAWHQVPAASLPKDEAKLAFMAGFGRDTRGWKRVRAGALRGFKQASDGRLYHPVIAHFALRAFRTLRSMSRNSQRRWEKAQDVENTKNRPKPLDEQSDDRLQDGGKPAAPANGDLGEGRGIEGIKKDSTHSPPRRAEVGAGAPGVGRGTRIAVDWQPGEVVLLWAVEQGWTREWALSRVDEFRDYWIGVAGAKGRKVDWDATFRNRLRETAARGRINGSASGTPAGDSVDLDARQWRSRVTVFANSGRWMEDLWGPAPGSAGCRAPADVLADHGYGGLALGVTSKPAA